MELGDSLPSRLAPASRRERVRQGRDWATGRRRRPPETRGRKRRMQLRLLLLPLGMHPACMPDRLPRPSRIMMQERGGESSHQTATDKAERALTLPVTEELAKVYLGSEGSTHSSTCSEPPTAMTKGRERKSPLSRRGHA